MVKNLSANAGAMEDLDLIPGSGSCPDGGNVYSLQYSCLENTADRGAHFAIQSMGSHDSSTPKSRT